MEQELSVYTAKLLALKEELLAYYKGDYPLERGRQKSEMEEKLEKQVVKLSSLQNLNGMIQRVLTI